MKLTTLTDKCANSFYCEIADVKKIKKPAELIDEIVEQLNSSEITGANVAFYQLRQIFVEYLNVPVENFTKKIELHHLLPLENRITQWALIQKLLKSKLPPLDRPKKTINMIITLFFSLLLMVGYIVDYIAPELHYYLLFFITLSISLIPTWLLLKITKKNALELPPEYSTIEQLCQFLNINDVKYSRSAEKQWTKEDVKQIVQKHIENIIGHNDFNLNDELCGSKIGFDKNE